MSSVSVSLPFPVLITAIAVASIVASCVVVAMLFSVRSKTMRRVMDSGIKPTCSDTSAPSLSTLLLDNAAEQVRFTPPSELRKRNE